MTRGQRTYRNVDGERVEGTWRPVFTRSMDTYLLTDLKVYADGAIDCGGGELTDLDGLREKLSCGCLATNLPEGLGRGRTTSRAGASRSRRRGSTRRC
ncbi:hypothetical protein GCM10027614_68190 [Micromonospora vulcania]